MVDLTLVEQLIQLGPLGILLFVFVLLQRGDLVLGNQVTREREQHAKQLEYERSVHQQQLKEQNDAAKARLTDMATYYEAVIKEKDARYTEQVAETNEWKGYTKEGTLVSKSMANNLAVLVERLSTEG